MVNQYTAPWTEKQLNLLKTNYNKMPNAQLSKLIPKHNVRAIQVKANKLGFKKSKDLRSRIARSVANWKAGIDLWDEKEIERVKKLYPTAENEQLLKMLPRRNWLGIVSKASKLGIKRLAHRRMHSEFMKNHNPMFNLEVRKKQQENTPRGDAHPSKKQGYTSPMKGRHHSTETKRKIAKSKIGKKRSLKTIRKMSMTMKRQYESGERIPPMQSKHHSTETKNMLSKTQKALWNNKDYAKRMMRKIHAKPNNIESQLIGIIEKNKLPFKFVGDGSVIIHGLNPDFIENNGKKKIIEVFGRVFHDPINSFVKVRDYQTETGRKKIFAEEGWDCLVFWDDELDDEEIVVSKINEFLG